MRVLRRRAAGAALFLAIGLIAAPGGAAPAATTIDELSATAAGSAVTLAGKVTLGGNEVEVGTDAANDNVGGANTAALGIDLAGATISQPNPTSPNLVFTIDVNGLTGGGIPEVVSYNWDIKVDGVVWRLTTMRTRALVTNNAQPYGALFTCVPGAGGTVSCTQNKLLPATYDEATSRITVTLPLADVNAGPGSVIERGAAVPIGIAATAAGRASVTNLYDTMDHEAYTVPSVVARAGIAPSGGTISYATAVTVQADGSFSVNLPAPSATEASVGARVCFGDNCAIRTTSVTLG